MDENLYDEFGNYIGPELDDEDDDDEEEDGFLGGLQRDGTVFVFLCFFQGLVQFADLFASSRIRPAI